MAVPGAGLQIRVVGLNATELVFVEIKRRFPRLLLRTKDRSPMNRHHLVRTVGVASLVAATIVFQHRPALAAPLDPATRSQLIAAALGKIAEHYVDPAVAEKIAVSVRL